MKLFIDKQLITGRVVGLDNLSVTHTRKGEGGSPSVAFTSEMQLYDDGYDIIKERLIDHPSGRLNTLSVRIEDDCCDEPIFEGKITGTTIEWCEDDCYISTQVIQDDQTAKILQCLRSTLITDDSQRDSRGRTFTQRNYPLFSYCNEIRPQFVHDILIAFGLIQEIVFTITIGANFGIIWIIIKIVSFLVNLFGDLFGIEVPNFFQFQEQFKQLKETARSLIVGCGRRHPTPLVRDYIENVCKACGLQWQSSILNSTNSLYFNLAYLNAPVKKGNNPLNIQDIFGEKQSVGELIQDNLPFKSGVDFLEEMKTVFNADYRINNNTLIFERRDLLDQDQIWREGGDLPITEGICYTWSGDEKEPASGKFSYAQDGFDTVGDEALGRYNDIVSWKGFDNQDGIQETNLLFGATRFRDDGIERDVISWWNRLIGNLPLIGDYFALAKDFDFSIILEKGKTGFPKLILWDNNFFNARVQRFPVTGYRDYKGDKVNRFDLIQNYPMFFDEGKSFNLYDQFHFIDDPRIKKNRNKTYEFTASFECGDLDTFDITKNIPLPGSFVGTMETVTINYTQKTININGKV